MTVDGIRFGDRCMVCLRCISRCPVQAITPRRYTFFPVKNYDLAALDTADLSQLRPRNWFERGYRTYLERKSHQFAA
jgi:formate hydrogenlyase subunit 6/NADH:ubiquinone oxidoreductase subunit I